MLPLVICTEPRYHVCVVLVELWAQCSDAASASLFLVVGSTASWGSRVNRGGWPVLVSTTGLPNEYSVIVTFNQNIISPIVSI